MVQVVSSADINARLAEGVTQIELTANGDYSGAVSITHGVTITRAAGVSIDDIKITGAWMITAAATSSVTLDGLRFVDITPTSNNAVYYAVVIKSVAGVDHVVENSVFLRDASPAVSPAAPVSNPIHYAGLYRHGGDRGDGHRARQPLP